MKPSHATAILACAASLFSACSDVRYPPLETPNIVPDYTWTNPPGFGGGAFELALDETHVYWGTLGGRTVRRAPKGGGAAETLVYTPSNVFPAGIAVDEARVYYGSTVDSTLESAPKTGGPATVLHTDDIGAGLFAVALDDTYVYSAILDYRFVRRMPKEGGPIEVLSDDGYGSTSIALDETYAYLTIAGSEDAPESASIARVPKGGGELETIAAEVDWFPHLALDDTHVYWVTLDDCRVQRAPKEGGPTITVSEGPARGHCFAIAVDGSHVYWASALDGAEPAGVWRVEKAGGERVRIATEDGVYGLALDDTHVYFSHGDGFRRLAK